METEKAELPKELKDLLDNINSELDKEKERLITEIAEKNGYDVDQVRIVFEEIEKIIVWDYKMYGDHDD